MKLQHLTMVACIFLATVSCNSGSTTTDTDSAANAMTEDTSTMMHDMDMMAGDTAMHHMQMCVVMENDKMMVMDSGKTTEMKEMITMDNGTNVKPDGSYTTADGKTAKLKNGECIMKDGMITTMDKMPM